MANTKISAFTSGVPAQSGDEFVIARSGSNYKLTNDNIRSLIIATANVFTKPQTFQPDSDAQAGTFRRNSSGQTSYVLEVQTEANATLAYVDKLGGGGFNSLTLSGNISSAAWTTNGIRYKSVPATLTDTTSSGTVAAAYTNVYGGNTIAASNSTTFTDYFTTFINAPSTGTNVTFTRSWALGLNGSLQIASASELFFSTDLRLGRNGAASLRLGAADAAAPVAQTLGVQGVVAGMSNTAGVNFTIKGSAGTGTGAGGSIIFQVAPAGSAGSSQNAYSTALTIDSTKLATFAAGITLNGNLSTAANTQNIVVEGSIGLKVTASQTIARLSFGIGDGSLSADCLLTRDAANTLALRNGTNAQRFNVYNTYTSSTNYETFKIDWITTANTCLIGTEKGSGGGTARALALQTDGTTRLTIAATGAATFGTSVAVGSPTVALGAYAIAASGTTRLIVSEGTGADGSTSGGQMSVYQNSGSATTSGARLGAFFFGGNDATASLTATAQIAGFATENWGAFAKGTRFEFATTPTGGTTRATRLIIGNSGVITFGATEANTVPALKPSSATLQVRLGDDSGFADLTTATIRLGGTTSSFPALKQSSATLQVRLADDSAFADLTAANLSGSTLTASSTTTNTAAIAASSYSLTGSSAVNMVDLSGTWNTSGVPTGIKLNITNTASGAGSLLLDLQLTSASKFKVDKDGNTTWADAANLAVGTTTGTKIGTATSQKIGFWNATPIVQPTTGVAAATVAGTGTGDVVAASTTFDGYTIPQIVKAMRNAGLLA